MAVKFQHSVADVRVKFRILCCGVQRAGADVAVMSSQFVSNAPTSLYTMMQ